MMQTPVQQWQGKSGGGGGLSASDRAMISKYMNPDTQMAMQGQSNADYAALNAAYNRYNTNGPLGSTYWSQGDPNAGIDWDAYSKADAAFNDQWRNWGASHPGQDFDSSKKPKPEDFKIGGNSWTQTTVLNPAVKTALDNYLSYSNDTTNKLKQGNAALGSDMASWNKTDPTDFYKGIGKGIDYTKYFKGIKPSIPDYYKGINVDKTYKAATKAWNNVNTNIQAGSASAGSASAGTATAGQAADTWGEVGTSGVGRGSESIADYLGNPALDQFRDYTTNYADIQGNEAVRQQVIDALNARMQPGLDVDTQALQSQMINMGVRPGTNVYGQQMQLNNQQRNDARMAAIAAGGDALAQQVQTEALARGTNLAQARQNQDIANELWGMQDTLANQRQQKEFDLFNVDYQNAALKAQQEIAKAQGRGAINIANAGYLTDASVANAGNQTQASVANANNQTAASVANANNQTNAAIQSSQAQIARAAGLSETAANKLTAKLAKAQGRTDRKITLTNQQLAVAQALANAGALTTQDKIALGNAKMAAKSGKTAALISLQAALRG